MGATTRKAAFMAASFLAVALAAGGARAESSEVRIADSLGLTHLPIRIAYEEHFIEKRAAELGMPDVKVTFQAVGSGVVVGQLLLAGQADLGVSGNVPMFVMSDKTGGAQKIRGIMALSKSNQLLLSVDPRIETIKDYGPNDRIAMPEAKVSTYALTLEIAAAKEFGEGQRNRFEGNAVAMSNSDAAAEMLSGHGDVKSHFTVLPFTALEEASGKAHVVLNSRDVIGFPYTSTAAITTEGFKDRNPTLYKAVFAALQDSIKFINDNPEQAAAIYLKNEKYPGGLDPLVRMIEGQTDDQLTFSPEPEATKLFTDAMYKDGMLKAQPASWHDEWFDTIWSAPGN